uniref:Uncharacterized protein n=1 Tax=Populus davidiana TaxID=266767 RepID=A0A6M2EJB4_9ROSI
MSFASVFGSPILWALNPSTASSFKPINGGIKIAVPAGTGFGYGGLSIECSLRPQTKATAHSHENKAKRESAIGHKAHLQVVCHLFVVLLLLHFSIVKNHRMKCLLLP